MLRLAVATEAETFDRLRRILQPRGIAVEHLSTTGRTIPLTGSRRDVWPRRYDVGFVFPPRPMEGAVAEAICGFPWLNDRSAVATSRNKAAVIARLARADVPVPESVLVSNPIDRDDLLEVFDRLGPSVVVKPNSAARGTGVVKVDDVDSLLGVSDYLGLLHEYPPTADKSFLLQEFLPDATDYRAMVLEGEYVGAVERRTDGDGWTHNVHRGAEAAGTRLSPDLRDLVERTAAVLDVPLLGVDVMVAGDRAVVSETNARPTIDDPSKYEAGFGDRLAAAIRQRAARRDDGRSDR